MLKRVGFTMERIKKKRVVQGTSDSKMGIGDNIYFVSRRIKRHASKR